MRKTASLGLLGMVAACAFIAGERDANACGGCMHEAPTPAQPQVESTIVSDHRMVFSVSQAQSVLWDQVRYSGNPREFAWVLPVKPGTRIELSRNEWIAALDATTQPRIVQPQSQPSGFGGGGFGGGDFGDESGGCGCGSSSTSAAFADGAGSSADGGAAAPPPPPVVVVNQETVGPYESVTIRSDMPNAMENWLRDHGYDIPDSVLPIITAYSEAKFDFIALRLQPGQGVQAMQPVRVVAPGADPTLPLRMVAAGVGASVGMTLFVISEGRYRPQNFPEATIDETKLVWNAPTNRSNYQELSAQVMAQANGSTWLTEYANLPITTGGIPSGNLGTLYDTYYSTCYGQTRTSFPDAGAPDDDAGADADAGGDDGGAPDAGDDDGGTLGTDAGGGIVSVPPPNLCQTGFEKCCEYDDLETAVFGMHRSDVWITRLRAELPVAALAQDLRLEAHPSQTQVSNVHNAQNPPVGGGARIAPRKRSPLGTGIAVMGAILLVARMLRRRSAPSASEASGSPKAKRAG